MRRARTAALLGVLLGGRAIGAAAQDIELRSGGPGLGPSILRSAVSAPHALIAPASTPAVLARDTTFAATVIVLGRDAQVASTVHGDVIVVHGDLFLHPGAHIDGRAVAYGGRVYDSDLATTGARLSYPDFTYDVEPGPGGTYVLTYRPLRREPNVQVLPPGIFGLDKLTYDRIDGASVSGGVDIAMDSQRVLFDPRLTYRSHLGAIDPSITAEDRLGGSVTIRVVAERASFTNDDWIHSDLLNSLGALAIGRDTRDYFRADRSELTGARAWDTGNGRVEPFVGVRWERDWSAPRDTLSTSAPWSVIRWHSPDGMLRPNPAIFDGHIGSLIGGAHWSWGLQDVQTELTGTEEVAFSAPVSRFAQTTVNGSVRFPTFGLQSYRLNVHAVVTSGHGPPQRWAYLGGAESIPTLETLSIGGDQLLFLDSRYNIPLPSIELPMVGNPALALRHVIGSAGVYGVPSFDQAVGVRLTVVPGYTEFLVDPARRHAKLAFGLTTGL